jgi:preprotein translocase subunit SecA
MYFTEEDKLAYITACIEHCWDKGRPVLIGTTSVNESEKVRQEQRSALDYGGCCWCV